MQISHIKSQKIILLYLSLSIYNLGCNKIVQVPEPINTITSSEAFSNDGNATSAVTAIYSNMSWGGGKSQFASGATSTFTGLSSDELNSSSSAYVSFQSNSILATNNFPGSLFWTPAYYDIYMANAVIEGLQTSTTVTTSTKNQLVGEAKFIRAFCHFYLANLFGNVPLVTTTAWAETSLMARTPTTQVYQQIISDLKDAQNLLISDYSLSNGERIRANKWAATALLARAYLYTGAWDSAEIQATAVISNLGTYTLLSNLDSVFLANSNEAILQLQTINQSPWATREGAQFVPPSATSSPNYYLTTELLEAFEPGDARKSAWVDSTHFRGYYYYYPYKYKVRLGSSGSITEYYMLLRFAEQYLIRAEARAEQNINLPGAISDLNIIRERAGLPDLPGSLSQSQVLAAVVQERRIEFFSEWGHRWFDLKRWETATKTLSAEKNIAVSGSALLYPIPVSEIQVDPNLTQNPGY